MCGAVSMFVLYYIANDSPAVDMSGAMTVEIKDRNAKYHFN
jgi:hypothetical protein